MLHGVHVLVKISDIPVILCPQACQPIVLGISPLVILMTIVTNANIFVLRATLVIDMITGNAIASQQLMTTMAKVPMPNTVTNPDQEQDRNQGPVLVIPEAQDMIIVTI